MGERVPQEIDADLRGFVERLRAKYRLQTVLLFGSRSRGDHLKSSDVDVVIVSQDFEGVGWRERIIAVSRLWHGRVRLEPLCYTPMEYAAKSRQITVVREAKREGLKLA